MARVERLFSAIVFANKRFIWNDLFRFHDSLRFDFEKSKARLSGRAKPSTQKLLHSDGRTAIRRRVCPREAAHTNLLRKPSGADGASSSKDHRAEAIDLFCESPAEPVSDSTIPQCCRSEPKFDLPPPRWSTALAVRI
ncbi:MAG TPA: hypothetical protein VNZ53_21860 [Steroidobacteraceae bacterium]|nr:hypothetical protein [Steroidobacteraceae bacterium]